MSKASEVLEILRVNEVDLDQDVLSRCKDCGYTASIYDFMDADRGDVHPQCPECGSKNIEDAELENGE